MTRSILLFICLLLPFQLTSSAILTQPTPTKPLVLNSLIYPVSSNYLLAKIDYQPGCISQIQTLPAGWVPDGQKLYIPQYYLNSSTGTQYVISATIRCKNSALKQFLIFQNNQNRLSLRQVSGTDPRPQPIKTEIKTIKPEIKAPVAIKSPNSSESVNTAGSSQASSKAATQIIGEIPVAVSQTKPSVSTTTTDKIVAKTTQTVVVPTQKAPESPSTSANVTSQAIPKESVTVIAQANGSDTNKFTPKIDNNLSVITPSATTNTSQNNKPALISLDITKVPTAATNKTEAKVQTVQPAISTPIEAIIIKTPENQPQPVIIKQTQLTEPSTLQTSKIPSALNPEQIANVTSKASVFANLPTIAEIKSFVYQNDTLLLSQTIQKVSNSALKCTEKVIYLQEVSGIIDIHVQDLIFQDAQQTILITAATDQSDRLEKQIQISRNKLDTLKVTQLQAKKRESVNQLTNKYSELSNSQIKLSQLTQNIAKLDNMTSELFGPNKTAYYKNLKANSTRQLLAYPQILKSLQQSSDADTVYSKLKQLQAKLSSQLFQLQKTSDQLKVSALQYEVDVSRIQSNLKKAKAQQLQLFNQIQSLQNRFFQINNYLTAQKKKAQSIKSQLSQISVYLRTVDQQINFIHFGCYGVVTVPVAQNNSVGVTEVSLTKSELQTYLMNVYNVSLSGQPAPTVNPPQPPNSQNSLVVTATSTPVTPTSNIRTNQAIVPNPQNPSQPSAQAKSKTPALTNAPTSPSVNVTQALDSAKSVKPVQNPLSSFDQKLVITTSRVVEKNWKDTYGGTVTGKPFSCMDSPGGQTGRGKILVIWGNMILAQSPDKTIYVLMMSPCTRVESVGSTIPSVGQTIIWKGEATNSDSVNAVGVSSF